MKDMVKAFILAGVEEGTGGLLVNTFAKTGLMIFICC
jgi:hypothetical protein